MTCPLLTVVLRFQQPVNEVFVGVKALVAQKLIDFFKRRREAYKIK